MWNHNSCPRQKRPKRDKTNENVLFGFQFLHLNFAKSRDRSHFWTLLICMSFVHVTCVCAEIIIHFYEQKFMVLGFC